MPGTSGDKRLLLPGLMTLLALAVLCGLGVWQLQRLSWKEGLIARLEARVAAQPVTLSEAMKAFNQTGDVEYLSVRAKGRFLHEKERYVYAVDEDAGQGFDVVTPLETEQGITVLVNRGFVPADKKDPASRQEGQIEGVVEAVGLVRLPGAQGTFTPEADLNGKVWYWRDWDGLVQSMFRGETREVAPFFLEAKAQPANPGGWPKGGVTLVKLPNRHLEYALTWFGLAAALVGVFLAYAVPRLRGSVMGGG